MKNIWIFIGLTAGTINVIAQLQTSQIRDVAKDKYSVIERGPHNRVWERIEMVPAPDGTLVERRHSYQELASGMHFKNERGEWEEAKEEIEILPNDVGAIAAKGQHKVIFPPEISTGLIELQTPEGQWLRSRVWGLSYFDAASGESVLLAEVKESDGRLVGDNVMVYPNAFTDFLADVRYTYTRAGFEQDVILRENPPAPQEFGLNPKTTRLQVLTEFVEAEVPRKSRREAGGLADDTLGFRGTSIGDGKAFSVDARGQSGEDVPVAKQWERLEGRDFLIEEVLYESVTEQLQKLPGVEKYEGASLQRRGKGETVLVGLKTRLPKRYAQVPPGPGNQPRRMARANYDPGSSFVMDYIALNTSETNFIFKADTTYYLSGTFNSYGTNTFEGGTVLKYATNASLQITPGPPGISPGLRWNAGPYRPVVFTVKDDNTVGETISGSSGIPSGYYGNPMLQITALGTTPEITGLRIMSARTGLKLQGNSVKLFDAQFVNCQNAISFAAVSTASLGNILLNENKTNFVFEGGTTLFAQNATISGSTYLATAPVAPANNHISLINCVIANVTNLFAGVFSSTPGGQSNAFFSGPTFGTVPIVLSNYPFQSVGGGGFYLATNSPVRNMGTTNLISGLLSALRQKTTYPPIAYTNVTFSGPMTFSPQAQRDTDAPDLGYHYDPLDYSFGGCAATSNLTFAAGTAVGWFRTTSGWMHAGQSIRMQGNITISFEGSATEPTRFVRLNTVQENDQTSGYGHAAIENREGPAVPIVRGRFLYCSAMANELFNSYFGDDYGNVRAEMTHSEFWGGNLKTHGNNMFYTNCLIWRSGGMGVINGSSGSSFVMRNCTMIGGLLYIQRQSWYGPTPVSVRDCSFDGTTFTLADAYSGNSTYTDYDFNAYTNSSNPFPSSGSHNVPLISFNWCAGGLGSYYLPTNSPLINTGSVTAATAGLYHFTTQTNQIREALSQVDIGYHYVALGINGLPIDTDNDGTPDYVEDQDFDGLADDWELLHFGNLAQTGLGDYDYDGRRNLDEYLEGTSPTSATSAANVLLARWTFDNTNSWVGAQGQLPTLVLNAQGRPSPRTNAAYLYNTNGAYLKYRDLEADGQANINCQRGTLRYWFKPEWSSANVGGTGPQAHGTMVWLGINTTNFWGVTIRPDGNSGHLTTKGPGETAMFGTTRDFPTTNWYSNTWHQIAITYSASQTKFYVDGQLVATNVGITYFPSAADRANGFLFGTPNSGNQSRGQFEELETYNYELSQAEVLAAFQASDLADADGDGVPVKEDIDPTNPNIGRLRITIEHPASGAQIP